MSRWRSSTAAIGGSPRAAGSSMALLSGWSGRRGRRASSSSAPAPATTSPCCPPSACSRRASSIHRARTCQRAARSRGEAALPDLSMFPARPYDLVALLDVLEHVPDDKGSLAAINAAEARRRLLRHRPDQPGGCGARTTSPIIITAAIGSGRSSRGEAGYGIEPVAFNSLLFPPIAAVRLQAS